MNNILIERKNHGFRHSAIKEFEEAWAAEKVKRQFGYSRFVGKKNVLVQYLVGKSFIKKKTIGARARDFVHVFRSSHHRIRFDFSRDSTLTANVDSHFFCFDCLFNAKYDNIVHEKIQKYKNSVLGAAFFFQTKLSPTKYYPIVLFFYHKVASNLKQA